MASRCYDIGLMLTCVFCFSCTAVAVASSSFFALTLAISFFCSQLLVRAWSSLNRADGLCNCSLRKRGNKTMNC